MAFYNQELLDCLPKGAEVVSISEDPTGVDKIRVDYRYNDTLFHVIPDRVNPLATLRYRHDFMFHHDDGMTVNFLYELFSQRHGLGFIAGEDYDPCDDIVPKVTKLSLPIRRLSLRYQPVVIPIELVDKSYTFVGDETSRNLADIDCNPFKDELHKRLLEISTFLIDGRAGTCFERDRLSDYFIRRIMEKTRGGSEVALDELRYAKVVGVLNDGLSDVAILSGPNVPHFIVRFLSDPLDVPQY